MDGFRIEVQDRSVLELTSNIIFGYKTLIQNSKVKIIKVCHKNTKLKINGYLDWLIFRYYLNYLNFCIFWLEPKHTVQINGVSKQFLNLINLLLKFRAQILFLVFVSWLNAESIWWGLFISVYHIKKWKENTSVYFFFLNSDRCITCHETTKSIKLIFCAISFFFYKLLWWSACKWLNVRFHSCQPVFSLILI